MPGVILPYSDNASATTPGGGMMQVSKPNGGEHWNKKLAASDNLERKRVSGQD